MNKVAKNAMWIIGCRVVQSLLALLINFLTARYLGPSNFGLINYAASIVAFAIPVMKLGIDSTLVNEIIQHPEKEGETMGTTLVMTMISSVACVGGVTAYTAIADWGDTETILVCVLYSLTLVAQGLELIQFWFQAKYLSKYTSLTVLGVYVIVSAYRIFLLVTQKSVAWFAVSQAIDYFLIAVILWIIYRQKGGPRLSVSSAAARRVFSVSKHYILPRLMVTVYAQTDRLMLKSMIGTDVVGYYSAAITITNLTNFVFSAIVDSMKPMLIEQKKTDEEKYRRNLSILYGIIIYLALLQCICVTLLAEFIVHVLYGEDYLPAVGVLYVVIWSTLFSYMGTVRSIWMLVESQQKKLLTINLSGIAANVALNVLLIPRWGMIGAAVASLITQILTNFVIGFVIKPLRDSNRILLRGLDPRLLLSYIATKKRK